MKINFLKKITKITNKYKQIQIYYHDDLDGKASFYLIKKFLNKIYDNKKINGHSINYFQLKQIQILKDTINIYLDLDIIPKEKKYILIDHHNGHLEYNFNNNFVRFINKRSECVAFTLYKWLSEYNYIDDVREVFEKINEFDTGKLKNYLQDHQMIWHYYNIIENKIIDNTNNLYELDYTNFKIYKLYDTTVRKDFYKSLLTYENFENNKMLDFILFVTPIYNFYKVSFRTFKDKEFKFLKKYGFKGHPKAQGAFLNEKKYKNLIEELK
jgi:hypothetical protein